MKKEQSQYISKLDKPIYFNCLTLVKMRGQGYDGASNMSGKFRGVKARVRQIFPEAIYTHCKAHCLNLAIIHASEEKHDEDSTRSGFSVQLLGKTVVKI